MTKKTTFYEIHSPKMDDVETQRLYLERFTRGVTHDVNNVFTYIMGMAEIAQLQPDLSEPVNSAFEKIVSYVERGRQLTQQVMDFGNSFHCTPRKLDLTKFIQIFKHDLLIRMPKDQSLSLHIEEEIGVIYVDETLLNKLLINVCMNAIEAMEVSEKEDKVLSLSIVLLDDGGSDKEIEFSISDNGEGISENDLPKVFIPFFGTKRTTKHAGVGLTTAQQIVHVHGGDIGLGINSLGGVVIKFKIPIHSAN